MSSKSLDKITVKDIVDDCDISRNTFYYNYQDIYAVIEELFESELESLYQQTDTSDLCSLMREFCRLLKKYEAVVCSVMNSSRKMYIENLLKLRIKDCVSRYVKSQAAGLTVSPDIEDFVAGFYSNAIIGYMFEWINAKMHSDINATIEISDKLFTGSIKKILTENSTK